MWLAIDCGQHVEGLTHPRMLLLLLEHLGLLWLQVRERMCVGSHARLHAHHRTGLADGPIGT